MTKHLRQNVEAFFYHLIRKSLMAFSSSFFGKAPCATCGISSIGMNSSVGKLVIPNAAASSFSSSVFTLYIIISSLYFSARLFNVDNSIRHGLLKGFCIYDDIIDEILLWLDNLYIFISFAK